MYTLFFLKFTVTNVSEYTNGGINEPRKLLQINSYNCHPKPDRDMTFVVGVIGGWSPLSTPERGSFNTLVCFSLLTPVRTDLHISIEPCFWTKLLTIAKKSIPREYLVDSVRGYVM